MNGVVQFIRSLILVAVMLGAAGTLVEATWHRGSRGCQSSSTRWY